MKRVLALVAIFSIYTTQALAMPARIIYSQDIDSMGIELKIAKGYGLTLDFIATGETIKQVWIGDPSRFAFTSNGNLCSKGDDQNCEGGKATVLFIRQIKPIAFPNMTSSGDGSTQITILTNQKQYQFKLIATGGQPSYTSLVIKPESEKPEPLLVANPPASPQSPLESSIVSKSQPLPVVYNNNSKLTPGMILQRNDPNALAYGLAIAGRNGQVKRGSTTWKKAQDAIRLLRQGKSREEAVSRSGIPAQVFNQLLKWGQQ
jgi:hypothetical protein